jgi:predicted dehydrogenase
VLRVDFHLGHGGKAEDGSSWKLNKKEAGGGVLIDPGIHLLDLVILMDLNIEDNSVFLSDGFWNKEIEENAVIIFSNENVIATINVSIVEWVNHFRLQVVGTNAQGTVTGRFGNYGNQKYEFNTRWGWENKHEEDKKYEFTKDDSFEQELRIILSKTDHASFTLKSATAVDGFKSMQLFHALSKKSKFYY